MYKNHFWTHDGEIEDKSRYMDILKKYYQISPDGTIINVYKRCDIPDEFNKDSIGSACIKGSKYKGYYWKNKL